MAKLDFVHMPVRAPVHKGGDLLYIGVVVIEKEKNYDSVQNIYINI